MIFNKLVPQISQQHVALIVLFDNSYVLVSGET